MLIDIFRICMHITAPINNMYYYFTVEIPADCCVSMMLLGLYLLYLLSCLSTVYYTVQYIIFDKNKYPSTKTKSEIIHSLD